MPETGGRTAESEPNHVTFSFIKSGGFRVVHVDGAIGGVTPRGYIHCAVFSERAAIPREATSTVQPDGSLGPLQVTEARPGIVRELEVDLLFDEQMAGQLYEWLGRQLEQLKQSRSAESAGGDTWQKR
jgi:hypothetical protein